MKEILPEIDRWRDEGEKVVVATVATGALRRVRSGQASRSPSPGRCAARLRRLRRERRLRERAGGARDGRAEAPLVRHRRRPRVECRRRDRRLPRAGRVGGPHPSTCGAPRVRGARILFTGIEGDEAGTKVLVLESGERIGSGLDEAVAQFDELIRRGRNRCSLWTTARRSSPSGTGRRRASSCTARLTPPRLQARSSAARVADARGKFATPSASPRPTSSDRRVAGRKRSRRCSPTTRPIVVLTHDDKFDEPALIGAPETEAFTSARSASRRNQSAGASGCSRQESRSRRSSGSWARAVSTSGPTRRRRRRSRSSRRSSPCADSARAASSRREEAHPRRGRVAIPSVVWLSVAPVVDAPRVGRRGGARHDRHPRRPALLPRRRRGRAGSTRSVRS